MATLRDIDDSWDYEVANAHDNYNRGGANNVFNISLLTELPVNTHSEDYYSQIEEEFNTCCDRCGEYIGYDKWHSELTFSQTVSRDPGLCTHCTEVLKTHMKDEGR